MSDFYNKSIHIKGNFSQSNNFQYCLSRIDFSKKDWILCANTIGYENQSNSNFSSFAHIKCNLIRDTRVFEKSTQSFMPTIATVLLKSCVKL